MTVEEASIYPELDKLIKMINSLPGIDIFDCEYNDKQRISIWFKLNDRRGLFLLASACSKRYWKNADDWMISVTTGDQFINNYLPVYFCLLSLKDKEECKSHLPGLVDGINKLMKDKSVLEAYNLGNLAR